MRGVEIYRGEGDECVGAFLKMYWGLIALEAEMRFHGCRGFLLCEGISN